MTTTWAAKVLEGVPRFHVLQKTWIGYADVLAALATVSKTHQIKEAQHGATA